MRNGPDELREKAVQIAAMKTTDEVHGSLFQDHANPIFPDPNSKVVVASGQLLEVANFLKTRSRLHAFDGLLNSSQKSLVFHFLQISGEAFPEGRLHFLP
jgi:hypothetical protein